MHIQKAIVFFLATATVTPVLAQFPHPYTQVAVHRVRTTEPRSTEGMGVLVEIAGRQMVYTVDHAVSNDGNAERNRVTVFGRTASGALWARRATDICLKSCHVAILSFSRPVEEPDWQRRGGAGALIIIWNREIRTLINTAFDNDLYTEEPIEPGMSGAVVLDRDGNLAGLINSYYNQPPRGGFYHGSYVPISYFLGIYPSLRQ